MAQTLAKMTEGIQESLIRGVVMSQGLLSQVIVRARKLYLW